MGELVTRLRWFLKTSREVFCVFTCYTPFSLVSRVSRQVMVAFILFRHALGSDEGIRY